MTDRDLARPLIERLRRAGTASPTRPDINRIMARATQRRRRRQIGVTAASVVVVGGLGVGSTQWLSGTTETEITATGTPAFVLAPASGSNPISVSTTTTAAPEPADSSAFAKPSESWATTTILEPEPPTTNPPEPTPEIGDSNGGTVLVEGGQLSYRNAAGELQPIDLPATGATTERRVTDLAPMDGRPYLLVADFTDRPDLAAEMATELGLGPDDPRTDDLMHHELEIHAVDLTTLQIYPVEQRTVTDRTSVDWVYNGHVTIQGDHLMVVRELWQSMCVFVEALTLDGTVVEAPQNPLPQPLLAGLSTETIRAMQAGTKEPPAGCLGSDELTDGAMSALGTQADPLAIAAINAELQSAAQTTMSALAD